ncbi:hypothetical protein [Mycobacterium sp. NPDC004974]
MTMNDSDSPRRIKNKDRRNAKIRLNRKLDALQRIENRQAELDGREPVDVITEYKRKRAKEREIIDAEVVEDESSEKRDPIGGGDSASHLPVPLPKIAVTEEESNPPRKHPQFSEQWWNAQPYSVQITRCRAEVSDGSGRCKRPVRNGFRVCDAHGGRAPQVKQAARVRLEMAADQLVQQLLNFSTDDQIKPETRLKATDSALDRIGLKAPTEVVLSPGSQQPTGFDEVFEGIYSGPRTPATQDGSNGLGIETNDLIDSVIGSGDSFDYSPENPAQQGNSETYGTKPPLPNPADIPTPAGTRLSADERCDPLVSSSTVEPSSARPSHRPDLQNGAEGHSGPREYGRPARPGATVSGFEAMRIAREAQEISRRLAGLESGLDD